MDAMQNKAPASLCPLQVEILMHYYARADGYKTNYSNANAEYLQQFVDEGVLNDSTSPWTLTEKGRAWVHAILTTPCPTPAWITAEGRVIHN